MGPLIQIATNAAKYRPWGRGVNRAIVGFAPFPAVDVIIVAIILMGVCAGIFMREYSATAR